MALSDHKTLIEAFNSISGTDTAKALGWVALDTKFERFVTAAVATAINTQADKRIAHVEFTTHKKVRREPDGPKDSRVDLVILGDRIPSRPGKYLRTGSEAIVMRYETKAGQLFDFAPRARTKKRYLGGDLDKDLKAMGSARGAGLFFISEISDPTRCAKYFGGNTASLDDALSTLMRNVTKGEVVTQAVVSCGTIDATDVKIHMIVFDRV